MADDLATDVADALACLDALRASEPGLMVDAAALADRLYSTWFHAEAAPVNWPSAGSYAAATARPELFEPGWTLMVITPEGIRARHRDGREAPLHPGGFAPVDPVVPLSPGLDVRRLRRNAAPVPGFWHLWSDGWLAAGTPPRLVRLYLPVARDGCREAARALLAAAPAGEVWSAKFLAGAHSGGRRDPALLYLPAGAEEASWVASVVSDLAPWLEYRRVRVARPWLGRAWLAPDPGGGTSFGQACCAAVAAAACAAGSRADRATLRADIAQRLAALVAL